MRKTSLRWAGLVGSVFVTLATLAAPVLVSPAAAGSPLPPYIGPGADWLTAVNYYRDMAHLPPVAVNPDWTLGEVAHSCYMLLNGMTHVENPSAIGYTTAGYDAGMNGNVTVSTDINASERTHVELWMAAPFHAIGLLRPGLTQTSYGKCTNSATPKWHSGATIDVIRGIDYGVRRPATPIVFPGDGSTTNLSTMSAETPDPRSYCGWPATEVGLPLIAMMPQRVTGAPSGSLSSAAGPLDVCVLSGGNTTDVAKSILDADNAVVLVPRAKLQPGTYTAQVNTSVGTARWSFTVDPAAATSPAMAPSGGAPDVAETPAATTEPLTSGSLLTQLPPTRITDSRLGQNADHLMPNQRQRIQVTGLGGVPGSASAISANFTITNSMGTGYLTVWNCSDAVPLVSTLNFGAGESVPNGASVPLDPNGGLCVQSNTAADLLIDVNGYYDTSSRGGRFVPVAPTRLMDTRTGFGGATRLGVGSTVRLAVRGNAGVPDSASMAVLNVTSVDAASNGYVNVFPCDQPVPNVSSLNPAPGGARPNLAIAPIAGDGSVCLYSATELDLVVDISGYIAPSGRSTFTTAAPFRLTDTRSVQPVLNAGMFGGLRKGQTVTIKVAGERGIAADAKAVSANITAVGGANNGYLTVWPCGPQPLTSTVNFMSGRDAANGTQVALSSQGTICIYANNDAQVIVDVNGWWG